MHEGRREELKLSASDINGLSVFNYLDILMVGKVIIQDRQKIKENRGNLVKSDLILLRN